MPSASLFISFMNALGIRFLGGNIEQTDANVSYTHSMKKIIFADQIRAVVRSIPKGKTMSYAEVAALAGYPGAARAVGSVMKNNYDKAVPCHRVIRGDGKIGEYNRGGSDVKRALLIKEKAINR
jgi:methylated-DNA-[protein]-cysteine S-methyltransferase